MERRIQAEQLAQLISRERLHPAALAAADASASKGERWLIALSGGADSVALLLLIWAHWPSHRARLRAAHFNHRLRGEESDGDETFCQTLCQALGIPFHTQAWKDAPAAAGEEAARTARYSFFECIAASEGASILFTGHQKDDIAETQLMRLARGASSAGLAAPRPRRSWNDGRTILRPLLSLARDELQGALKTVGVAWREDSSNAQARYLRNRVRRDVVPNWLQAAGPGALEGAALTREWLEEDDAALEHALNQLGIPEETDQLDLRPLAGQPRALWRRALRRWSPLGEVNRRAFDELLTLCQSGQGQLSVGTGFARVEAGVLQWVATLEKPAVPWTPARLPLGACLILPDGSELTCQSIKVDEELRERFLQGAVDPRVEAVVQLPGAEFVVRSWMPGDRYRPLGAPGSAKLQDLFINRKISAPRRSQLPILCTIDGCIIWVPGFPPAACSKVTDECVTALQLTYTSGTYTVRK